MVYRYTRKSISCQSALLWSKKPQAVDRHGAVMDPAPDEGSSAAAEAAQQLVEVLLPIDATPTLAAHVAPHAAFVSSISERADVVLASALFRELSQRFEKLTPLQRFSLHLSLLKHAPSEFRRRLEDSPDEWLAAVAPCVAVVVYLRRGAAIAHASSSDDLLEVLDDAELAQSRQDDAATFAASLYCVCLGLEWLGRTAYDERMEKGLKRDGNILLGYDEDLTASESCVYDFAHVLSPEGFALTRAEIKKHYVVVHLTQTRGGVSWEAVIARAHVLAAEVKRVKSEVHTTTPGLKAAEARARVGVELEVETVLRGHAGGQQQDHPDEGEEPANEAPVPRPPSHRGAHRGALGPDQVPAKPSDGEHHIGDEGCDHIGDPGDGVGRCDLAQHDRVQRAAGPRERDGLDRCERARCEGVLQPAPRGLAVDVLTKMHSQDDRAFCLLCFALPAFFFGRSSERAPDRVRGRV